MRYTKLLLCVALLFGVAPAHAYIEAPMTLGDVVNQSNMITMLRVLRVDKPNKLVFYEKVEDIKGKFPSATCRHVISGQLKEGEIKTVLDWAERRVIWTTPLPWLATSIHISSDGTELVVGSHNKAVYLFDFRRIRAGSPSGR